MTGPRRNMIGLHLAASAVGAALARRVTHPEETAPGGHTRSDAGPPVIFVSPGADRTYVEDQIRRLVHEHGTEIVLVSDQDELKELEMKQLDALFPERLGDGIRRDILTLECKQLESMRINNETAQERRTPKQPWYAKFQKSPKKSRANRRR